MNYRNLFRKLEENLAQIERTDDIVSLLSLILERVVEDFRDDLRANIERHSLAKKAAAMAMESELHEAKAKATA